MKGSKIATIAVGVWISAAIVGGLLSMLEASQVRDSRSNIALSDYQTPDLTSWKAVFSAIEKFNPEPVKVEDVSDKSKPLPQISDAILVGTVLANEPKALLVLPGKFEAEEFSVGGQWLTPWTLVRIEQNQVVWQNQETNQQQQQVLFQ